MILKKFAKFFNNMLVPIAQGGTGHIPTNITIDKEYELIETFVKDGVTMHKIVNDRGKNANYMADRFQKPIQKIMLCKKDGKLYIVEKQYDFEITLKGIKEEQDIFQCEIIWQEFDERIIYFKGGTKNLRKSIISDLSEIGYGTFVSVDKLVEAEQSLYKVDTREKKIYCAPLDNPQLTYILPEDYDTILKEAKRLMQTSVFINSIGSQNLSIEITAKQLKTKYGDFTIGELKECINFYISLYTNCSFSFGQYSTALTLAPLKREDRIIRIGCEEYNNLFSMKELETIAEVWYKNFGK